MTPPLIPFPRPACLATGRVLAMAGFDQTDPAGNPCLQSKVDSAEWR